jgi:hypothetical protein
VHLQIVNHNGKSQRLCRRSPLESGQAHIHWTQCFWPGLLDLFTVLTDDYSSNGSVVEEKFCLVVDKREAKVVVTTCWRCRGDGNCDGE